METKDELLSEGEKYFEKVMQDFNQNRKGRNLRKYCSDEGIDYKWLYEYKRTYHHITREQAMFLLSNAVQSEIYIYDDDKDDQRAGGGIWAVHGMCMMHNPWP